MSKSRYSIYTYTHVCLQKWPDVGNPVKQEQLLWRKSAMGSVIIYKVYTCMCVCVCVQVKAVAAHRENSDSDNNSSKAGSRQQQDFMRRLHLLANLNVLGVWFACNIHYAHAQKLFNTYERAPHIAENRAWRLTILSEYTQYEAKLLQRLCIM